MASPVNESQSGPPSRSTLAERVDHLRRLGFSGSAIARGMALFGALIAFTLLYAFVLQKFSRTDDAATHSKARPAQGGRIAFHTLDDSLAASSGNRFSYDGAWQHIKNEHDGRSNGTSSRAYRVGATASFRFTGVRLKLYGVKGPNGGYAELRIDGETFGLLRFYAPRKAAGVLVYASPLLPAGTHAVAIIVADAPGGLPKRRFVNLDGAAYSAH